MDQKESWKPTPIQVVDQLRAWLDQKIGDVAEDDWLLLDDFEKYCDGVRREWSRITRISIANPDVRRKLEQRCQDNLAGAKAALAAIVAAWLQRK